MTFDEAKENLLSTKTALSPLELHQSIMVILAEVDGLRGENSIFEKEINRLNTNLATCTKMLAAAISIAPPVTAHESQAVELARQVPTMALLLLTLGFEAMEADKARELGARREG